LESACRLWIERIVPLVARITSDSVVAPLGV
jgi:hypothetical protein